MSGNPRIILLSGPIGSGKSRLAAGLVGRHGARLLRTRDLIRAARPGVPEDRRALQRAGAALDRTDGGEWVKTALARLLDQMSGEPDPPTLVVVDAVRIEGQVAAVRSAFGTLVHHIHLTAGESALADRYASREAAGDEGVAFEAARRQRTEKGVEKLAALADVVIETDRSNEDAVLTRATALLGLYPRSVTPLVDVLVGGQYGSEGKGNIVGHIAPEYDLLVRVGGPNAGHKVFGDPVQVYYHLPSGSRRAPHAKLLLGAGAVLRIPKLLKELGEHGIEASRLSIDPQAMIIEDEDIAREGELAKGISSTQQGVGSASANKIMGRAGMNIRLARDVPELRPYLREAQEVLEDAYLRGYRVMLEGTQGTTLSMHHGPYPFVTSRDTTASGCLADAGISPMRVRRVIMVCRTYPIRVGGPSGPMEGELSYEELAARSGIPIDELRTTETTTTTKRQRRIAEFDWVQLRRSALLNGPTDIALTFADYLGIGNRGAYRVDQLNQTTLRFIEEMERVSGVPVSMVSTNFGWRNVIDRRTW
ncbi:adenylosuccinate synthetase [Muricoccus vinaceus]|uniref:Adenylosuccinate synthetase n=1 Tax=Muricoccus vinaceus TaxID=424704 RepID=A0ABV6J2Q0_9PROT